MSSELPKLYTTGTASVLLGVTPTTLITWCDAGEVAHTRTDAGVRLIAEDEIVRIQNKELDEFLARALPIVKQRVRGE